MWVGQYVGLRTEKSGARRAASLLAEGVRGVSSCACRQFQDHQKSLPSLFTTGFTHLVPKDEDTTDPSKYRTIMCLPTIYKTLTSILSAIITHRLNSNQVMSRAQNGCRGGGRGTKEPLLINAIIGKVVKRNRRNFSAAWMDYNKAFDSVPHTWLKRILELCKVNYRTT
ncbi:unnamed protein product [Parnassius mnemosyne]|uniref:Reverse transcriptase domain-containing protein n=1 Tax=Parnassius mnemosyne TaxID=213953 RepID=A0AAV1KZU3_9NEOP